MHNYDPQLAQRVWQRVQGGGQETDPQPPLFSLLYATAADAALCLQLADRHKGSTAALLREISTEKQGHASCLKGILQMAGEASLAIQASPGSHRTPQAALRHCLGSTLRCAEQYRQWQTHGEYGPVFAVLGQQEAVLAKKLLQALGQLS